MGCKKLGLMMNSQSRLFEAPIEETLSGVLLRCHRPMRAQALVPWTPIRALAALFQAAAAIAALTRVKLSLAVPDTARARAHIG
jgi:hypothetical protein